MSERARQFVEAWIRQFVRAGRDEHPLNLFESRADAIACVYSALADGISRLVIREEYGDLVRHIAAARHRFAAMDQRLLRDGESRCAKAGCEGQRGN